MSDPQELCLEGESGAGAKYMHIYDELHYSVRERLSKSKLNLCLACLHMRAQGNPNPNLWHDLITHFERGTINDYRSPMEGRARDFYQDSFRRFYEEPNYSSPNFNYTIYPNPRDLGDAYVRSLYPRMEQRSREYFSDFPKGTLEALFNTEITFKDWND